MAIRALLYSSLKSSADSLDEFIVDGGKLVARRSHAPHGRATIILVAPCARRIIDFDPIAATRFCAVQRNVRPGEQVVDGVTCGPFAHTKAAGERQYPDTGRHFQG